MECHVLVEEGLQEVLIDLPSTDDNIMEERDPLEIGVRIVEEKDITQYEFGAREFAVSYPLPLKEEDEGEEEEEGEGEQQITIKDEETFDGENESTVVPETILIECDVNEISENIQFIDNKLTLVVDDEKSFKNDSVNHSIENDCLRIVEEKIAKTYFACKICKLGFETESEFLKHSEIHFLCVLCKKVFLERVQLERHINTAHSGSSFKCSKCTEVFPSSSDLFEHEQTHHTLKMVCYVCGKTFKYFRSLSAHLKTHNGVKPHICNICNESFSNSTNLRRHIVIHTGLKPFTCMLCNKGFRLPEYLQRHMQRHARPDIPKPFKCDICEKRFSRSLYLHEHFSIHTGDRPFKCEVCEVTYRHSSSLRRHMESHSESSPT